MNEESTGISTTGWTLSAGLASAASFATLSPGSSAQAIPAGVATLSLQSSRVCKLLRNDALNQYYIVFL
ncbi:hypothetical protein FG382_06305 [Psychrobacillus lasiicapitis]|uniref:Uncharacterized protein n=1 Tax=Psychrobacillus lasiicapitis TaxID=1636719 RepID=A0A544TC89_9BACI|nr:hypothetical protein FG382_06305 [Psychrobacillus lasiicapitis]